MSLIQSEHRVQALRRVVTQRAREIDRLDAVIDVNRKGVEAAQADAEDARQRRILTEAARQVLEKVRVEEADRAQGVVANLVTTGLRLVFGEQYTFKIETKILRGLPHLDMWIQTEEEDLDIVDSHGGGLAEVVSFLLRVVMVVLDSSATEHKTLILDEPFSHLSDGYVPRMASFLRTLVDQTGVQLIVVSHEKELAQEADFAYEFVRGSGGVEVRT